MQCLSTDTTEICFESASARVRRGVVCWSAYFCAGKKVDLAKQVHKKLQVVGFEVMLLGGTHGKFNLLQILIRVTIESWLLLYLKRDTFLA